MLLYFYRKFWRAARTNSKRNCLVVLSKRPVGTNCCLARILVRTNRPKFRICDPETTLLNLLIHYIIISSIYSINGAANLDRYKIKCGGSRSDSKLTSMIFPEKLTCINTRFCSNVPEIFLTRCKAKLNANENIFSNIFQSTKSSLAVGESLEH